MDFLSIDQSIGNTCLVRLQRVPSNTSNTILAKMEGDNPAGSVKGRPAVSMIMNAQIRGEITPGDYLIVATSGNTGITLVMAAAMMDYKMTLIMSITATMEHKMAMRAYGAELIEVSGGKGMEGARDLAKNVG
jgi:cysteine synthase B